MSARRLALLGAALLLLIPSVTLASWNAAADPAAETEPAPKVYTNDDLPPAGWFALIEPPPPARPPESPAEPVGRRERASAAATRRGGPSRRSAASPANRSAGSRRASAVDQAWAEYKAWLRAAERAAAYGPHNVRVAEWEATKALRRFKALTGLPILPRPRDGSPPVPPGND